MSGRWMMVWGAAVGLLLSAAAGCVSKDQYDQAVAASRRASEVLKKTQGELQTAQEANRNLRADQARLQMEMDARDKLLASLKDEKDAVDKKFADLEARYRKAADQHPPDLPTLTILPKKLDEALRALAQQNAEIMEYLPQYGMIKLKADLTFDKGSTEISAQGLSVLKKLGEIINGDPAKTFYIYVAGHTDDIPVVNPETIQKHGTNWGLSAHRALEVVKALFEAGVEQPRMAAVGFGQYHPIAPNRPNHQGNPVNRRVEIWIVPPDRLLTAGGAEAPAGAGATVAPEK